MKIMSPFSFSSLLAVCLLVAGGACVAEEPKSPPTEAKMEAPKPEVVLSEEEWKKRLTAEQFAVARKAGTERPFGEIYETFEKQGEGTYYCVCCGVELFTSNEKFHSGCGWPSFYDASKAKNVLEKVDNSLGMARIETVCKRCGAHLGHVFEGESISKDTPTNRRFCINGVALKFVEAGGKAPELLVVASEAVQKKKAEVAKEGGVEAK
jgi:peptide-methionine (R)-S-oxide reductase